MLENMSSVSTGVLVIYEAHLRTNYVRGMLHLIMLNVFVYNVFYKMESLVIGQLVAKLSKLLYNPISQINLYAKSEA